MKGYCTKQVYLGRREFLIGLSAASLLLAAGCASFRTSSDLDTAFEDLDALLDRESKAHSDKLASIAERIRDQSRALVATHETFITDFNGQASNRSVTVEELQQLVADYESRRVQLRNDLLLLQDELHTALPPDVWQELLKVLNRKSQAMASKTISGT